MFTDAKKIPSEKPEKFSLYRFTNFLEIGTKFLTVKKMSGWGNTSYIPIQNAPVC